jgi:hypothetical protein
MEWYEGKNAFSELLKNLCRLSPQANDTDRATALVGEVSANFSR